MYQTGGNQCIKWSVSNASNVAECVLPQVTGDNKGVCADLLGRSLSDHPSGFKAVDAVADRHYETHVVLNHQHGCAEMTPDLGNERPERFGFALSYARSGFVEAQQLGVERQQTGEFNDSPSSSRQITDVNVSA